MIGGREWLDANTAFLAAAVDWVGGRVQAAIGDGGDKQPVHLAELDGSERSAFGFLRDAFGLSNFELETLALCAAVELDTALAQKIVELSGERERLVATFALAIKVFADPSWDAMSAEQPLRYWRIIEIDRVPGQPLISTTLRCDERILGFIKGLNRLDERIALLTVSTPIDANALDATSDSLPAEGRLRHHWSSTGVGALMIVGADSATRSAVASAAASACGRLLTSIPSDALALASADMDAIIRLLQRESRLLPLALFIDAGDMDGAGELGNLIVRLLQRVDTPVVLAAADAWARVAPFAATIILQMPGAAVREAAWALELGHVDAGLAVRLGEEFAFGRATISQMARASAGAANRSTEVWRICRDSVRARLDPLAQRVEPRAGWDDIVLPAEQRGALEALVDQMRRRRQVYREWGFGARTARGLGISALFAGESGTGKTMAAEVIASALDLNLYRIDLSAVVSKYIGETEKNLRRLFDAADQGGTILFFDEADALFGRRSEVKDSHDRYANIEINYLLQRIENFSGLAILATNMKAALDPAFMRRLRFVVQFPYPGAAERALIWRKAFPPEMPRGAIDFGQLSRLNLTGGNILNAALNAAFLAAAEGVPLDTRHALTAARGELVKLDRAINEADFAPVRHVRLGSAAA